ncbi:MAG: gluconate 2-dehydrogenase subunit 3 family protein [Saprospiraceae bacterium]|nr:gluconate 2-dehydrogenase subunit 3 family protein [Saprospiraceae bacterium]
MNRRELLQRSALLVGGSLLGADSLLAKNINWDALDFEQHGEKGIGIFSKAQVRLMNEIAETILPATDTPGAKAAKTGQFMAVIVSDCYDAEHQKRFLDGLVALDTECKGRYGKTFLKCSAKLRFDHLAELDAAQKAYQKTKGKTDPDHYFRVIKDLALWGYFTSEIGSTQALRYVEYPGRYTTIDYKKGDRAWGG